MTNTCNRCKFFCSAGSVGECRFRAPTVPMVENATVWPLVGKEDWCGDWEKADDLS